MADNTDIRDEKATGTGSANRESGTTLSNDSYLNSGLLDNRDPKLERAHDYQLDQDLGETMEQVNANLHLGAQKDAEDFWPAPNADGGASAPSGVAGESSDDGTPLSSDPQGLDRPSAGLPSENRAGGSGGAGPDTPLSTQSDLFSNSSRPLSEFGGEPTDTTPLAQSNGFAGAGGTSDGQAAIADDGNEPPTGPVASNISDISDIDGAANAVSEAAEIGAETGIQAFTSTSRGASVTYSLSDDAGGLFSIDPETGIVSVAGNLDAETALTHTIEVVATASDGATETRSFTIAVQDANEFGASQATDTDGAANTLTENAGAGSYTGITASADDQDATDTISYSVSDPRFEVDENGIVTVAEGAAFDTESEPAVSLTVTATSSDGSSTSQTFTLTVTDIDEFDVWAVTDSDATDNSLAENASEGTTVGVVASASDADITDSVAYSVDDARFTVDVDGTVRVAAGASFDAETEGSIDILVTATSTDGSTSNETFTLNVTDIDEFDVGAVTDTDATDNSLAENASEGTTVGVVASASDADITDSVAYSVDDARFTVDADGTVRVASGASFDAETEGSIDIVVTATSTDGSTSNETFTLNVTDIDEFDVGTVTDTDATDNSLAENASEGTAVGVVASASDADITDSVAYSVNDARFTVDADGTVRVATGASFDAETEGSIDIVVTATSTDGSTSNETFTINVTDNDEFDVGAVTDTDATDNSLAENASEGTAVGVVASASDADITDSVAYSVDDARFTVDADGTVRVATGASFDAETEGSIDIIVTATSTDGSTSNETFTINVTDIDEFDVGAVTDSDATDNSLAENASEGTAVGVVASASDADITDSVAYSVDDARFTVDADGTVRVANGASFDAETEGSIDIVVTATSTDGSTSSETFTLNVTDIDEFDVGAVTDSDTTDNSHAENAGEGTAVGVVASASDADITDSVAYSVDDARFTVDADGTVRVANGASFDAETEGSIEIVVTATSTDGSTSNETFTINVTDIDEFDVGAVTDSDATDNSLAENASEGTAVGVVASASDADITDSVAYSVNDARFTVDADGTVRVANGASFDAETEGSIEIVVTATSTDGSTSSETFTLNVTDIDEFNVGAVTDSDATDNSLAENAGEGTAVGVVASASDADITDSVAYSVNDARFTVDADGTVRVASGASFDAETEGSIDIVVTATSTDGSTSNETFTINVTDIDEFDVGAVTDSDTTDNSLAENAGEGTAVGVVASASDADITDSVAYSVDDARFTVDADGTVRVATGASFDAETEGSIDIVVTATSTDGSTSSETFTLNVTDIDEFDVGAVTDSDTTDNSLAENASEGTAVGVVASASDADITDSVAYSVDDARFTVDADGTVRVAAGESFDAETEGSIDIVVTATSTDGSTSNETFTINVTDIDEFDVGAVTDTDATDNSLAENASEGTAVGVVASASDADITDSVAYSLDDARFTVDADGTVRVAAGASFDAETENAIDIVVTATSTDGSTSSQTFTVDVSDINEFGIGALGDANAAANSVSETAPSGLTVGVTASAQDADLTDTVTYAMVDQAGNSLLNGPFAVDATTGVVTVRDSSQLDAETAQSHTIYIKATSSDGTSTMESFVINVADNTGEATVSALTDANTSANLVSEQASVGQQIGITAFADDADISDSVTYSIVNGAGNPILNGPFAIDPDTGVVTVADPSQIDAENQQFMTIYIRATSTDGTTSTDDFLIQVSDIDEFDIGAVIDTDAAANSVAEDASAGTAVGVVATASDADVSDSVAYSVDDNRFTIDADGTVRVANGAAFDAETESSIDIVVTATSTDGSSSQETFTLDVANVNEHAPTDILISGKTGNLIQNGSFEDVDIPSGRPVNYGTDPSGAWTISNLMEVWEGVQGVPGSDGYQLIELDSNVGLDAISQTVDTKAGHVYEITFDTRSRSLSGSDTVEVYWGGTKIGEYQATTQSWESVTFKVVGTGGTDTLEFREAADENSGWGALLDNISLTETPMTIGEGVAGAVVGDVTTMDADITDTHVYTVSDSRFEVAEDGNGVMQLKLKDNVSLDAEAETSITLTVTTTDSGGLSYSEDFTVHVGNFMDETPTDMTFTGNAAATISANVLAAGTVVAAVASVVDADAGDSFTYALTNDASGKFTIDASTGEISLVADHDATSTYSSTLDVQVTDAGGNSYTEIVGINLGTDGAETQTGTAHTDVMYGFGGNDTLNGADGDDVLIGGSGTNTLNGEAGNDTFLGGGGSDAFNGGTGTDHVDYSASGAAVHVAFQAVDGAGIGGLYKYASAGGLSGDAIGDTFTSIETITTTDYGDRVYGAQSDMTYNLGSGNDVFDTSNSNTADTVYGGSGNDFAWSGAGNDNLYGGEGNDLLSGEDGNDRLHGDEGNDLLRGADGDDTLIGGTGTDTLIGGDGSDLFMHGLGDGNDTVFGGAGVGWTDAIDVSGGDYGLASAGEYGTDWTITITEGSIVNTDTANKQLDLSDDAHGTIDFSDGTRIDFADIEEIRW